MAIGYLSIKKKYKPISNSKNSCILHDILETYTKKMYINAKLTVLW